VELERLRKELLAAQKTEQKKCLRSILGNEGIRWSELYQYVKRRKGIWEIIPATKTTTERSLRTLHLEELTS
jgi:hypothetical protein